MAAAVNEKSAAVLALSADWPMTEALLAGTSAMRIQGERLLPKYPAEEADSYTRRLSTATLFPALRRTVSVMTGKPFSKAITFGDDVPEEIAGKPAVGETPAVPGWADDIDREGVNLHSFAAEMLAEALSFGLCGILVETPKPVAAKGPKPTKAEQAKADVRPYWVRVKHNQILGWRAATENGKRVLKQLRLMECVTEEDGAFGEKSVEQVRVLEPGIWQVWRQTKKPGADGKPKWELYEYGTSGLDVIPFVPLYGVRRGFMDGVSPLLDLAFLNVKHWQSQSDQDNILNTARVPILAIIGGDKNSAVTIGAGAAVAIPSGGDMKFVEHTGAAIEAGQKSLDALEEQMIQAGAELLVKKPGERSATESANDAEGNKSDLQRLVEVFEDSLDQALYLTARYAGLSAGGHVSLFKDFGAATLSEASGQLILAMWNAGAISHDTMIEEQKRRGELSAEVDAATERDKVDEEGGGLGGNKEDPADALKDEIVDPPVQKPEPEPAP